MYQIEVRVRRIFLFSVGLVVFLCGYLIITSGVVIGANSAADARKDSAWIRAQHSVVIEGSIVDRNGTLITSASDVGKRGVCHRPSCSYLVGYYSPFDGGIGLRSRFAQYLYDAEPGQVGCTLQLTLDCELQDICLSLLQKYERGSIVVLDRTGAIMCLADRNTVDFDVNLLRSEEYVNQVNNIDNFWLPPSTRVAEPPGSVFKLISAAVIIENGMEEVVYYDSGEEYFDNHKVVNYGGYSYGAVTLRKALVKSVNTYFSHIICSLGRDALQQKADAFCIGQDIELDFTTLHSNFDLEPFSKALLADSSYGQGKLLVAPLQIATIGQTIANNGVMVKPHLIEGIYRGGEAVYQSSAEILSEPISRETAAKLTEYMLEAGKSYGLADGIAAKSGTAQIRDNYAYSHAYLLTFSKQHIVLISANDCTLAGSQLAETANAVYEYLWSAEVK